MNEELDDLIEKAERAVQTGVDPLTAIALLLEIVKLLRRR
jgi:hypothetical protein